MPTKTRTATPSDLEVVSQWGEVIQGFQATNRKLHAAIAAAFSLDPAEAETLLGLVRTPGHRASMATLARDAAFSSGGFTKIADRLAKRQLVQRTPCADDRRVTYLELTEAGRAISNELLCLVSDIVRGIYVDTLGPERAQVIAEAMAELRDANNGSAALAA